MISLLLVWIQTLVSQLYFTSRMGPNFRLSSVQAALLCGMGLQFKSVEELTSELGLPINQVLAMFNKAVKKMSLAFNQILVDEESKGLLGGDAIKKVESKMQRIRDVVGQTLEEDAAEGAAEAMEALKKGNETNVDSGVTGTHMTPEISDPEIMKYALKGTDEEWADALKKKDFSGSGETVQIKSTKPVSMSKKRKSGDELMESILKDEKIRSGKKDKGGKKKSSRKKSRKSA